MSVPYSTARSHQTQEPKRVACRLKQRRQPRWAVLASVILGAGLQAVGGGGSARAVAGTGTWSTTGEIATERIGHTATILDGFSCRPNPAMPAPSWCGKVLLAGGASNTAELYDPATGTSAPTSPMIAARAEHTATVLNDGRVLVVGGRGESRTTVVSSAEIYDPRLGPLGQWTTAGVVPGGPADPTPPGRVGHSASMLGNGTVLVAGGFKRISGGSCYDVLEVCEAVASAAAYDPSSGSWTPVLPMSLPRARHSATILGGPPCGAVGAVASCGSILVAGGGGNPPEGNYDDVSTGSTAEVYDQLTGTWRPTTVLEFNRWGHTATLLPSGKVLVAGGLNCVTNPPRTPGSNGASINLCGTTPSAELYDPLVGTWMATGSMSNPRIDHTATALDAPVCAGPARPTWCGMVLVAGGNGGVGGRRMFSAEVFDPDEGGWSAAGSLVQPRSSHTATSLDDGQVLVTGGQVDGTSVETFQPEVTLRRPTIVALEPSTGPVSGKSRIVIRGAGFSDVTAVHFGEHPALFYRVDSSTTITAASPPVDGPKTVHVTVSVGSGRTSAITSVDRFTYHDVNGTWSATSAMSTARSAHTATTLGDGSVLVVGGLAPGSDGPPLRTSELYDGLSRTWRPAPELNEPRAGHTASRLQDGSILVVGGGSKTSEVYKEGKWTVTSAQLNESRTSHTASLLLDGTVLVTGGKYSPDTSEIYDPTTQTWAIVQDGLASGHYEHTATRLDDGTVLVAGGTNKTAELFDPSARSWTTVGEISVPRLSPTATLLPGGLVLLAGGSMEAQDFTQKSLDTAELYDPVTRSWELTRGKLSHSHTGHSATHMGAGRVLVAGGGTAAADIYEPSTRTWLPALPLLADRSGHTATLLSGGTVLVAGGEGTERPRLSTAELFDPKAPEPRHSILEVTPPVGTTSGGSSVTIIGSGFFHPETTVSFGGVAATSTTIASDREIIARTPPHPPGPVDLTVKTPSSGVSSTRYDYAVGDWAVTDSLAPCTPASASCLQRHRHTATTLADGRILLAGGALPFGNLDLGSLQRGRTATSQLFDPPTGSSPAASMLGARSLHTATLLADGTVLVVGLPDPGHVQGNELPEIYHPTIDKWTPTSPMTLSRQAGHTATRLQSGHVLVVGGLERADATDVSELYDPSTRLWSVTSTLDAGRRYHTATLLDDGRVLVAGGEAGNPNAEITRRRSVEVYDPAQKRWTALESGLVAARSRHTATLLNDGRVLVVGGDGADGALDAVEILDPRTENPVSAQSVLEARSGHTATKLPDGRVLVAGGVTNGTAVRSSEIYDPEKGSWSYAGLTEAAREGHAANLLEIGRCGSACGRVLITGGKEAGASAEVFTAAPQVSAVSPSFGPSAGGTPAVITGRLLNGATGVSFGGVPAASFTVVSPTQIVAVTPPHQAGTVEVVVTTPGGSSLANPPRPNEFTFVSSGVPGGVTDLAAKALSEAAVELSWTTAGSDGAFGPPATRYVVKESTSPITDEAGFDAATSVCGGACPFPSASLGRSITFAISGLRPGTGYHYSVRAVGPNGVEGPISNLVSVTTGGTAPALESVCSALPAPALDQVPYPGGYSMVGLPAGTRVGAQSPLYGWFDIGAGGAYSTQGANNPVAEGRGYWAWFSCPRLVTMSGAGAAAVELPLGGYRASMVGNPSGTRPAVASGHDFAARWDPNLNGGAGGYRISEYREEQVLGVGQAIWAFSYRDTKISVRAR